MQPMTVSNDLLGQPDALAARAAQEGYLFFKNVLDQAALLRVKNGMMGVLSRVGFIEPRTPEPVYAGGGSDIGRSSPKWLEDEYNALRLWEQFVDTPAVQRFFVDVYGEPAVVLPMSEYRSQPPGEIQLNWHQDGFRNPGLDLWIAWIPLVSIPEDLGGLAVAEGMNRQGYLHVHYPPPQYRIPDDAIPHQVRRRGDYALGDVVLFTETTPHTGLSNRTERGVRMSFELRLQRQSSPRPVIGTVAAVASGKIVIKSAGAQDEVVTLTVDDTTMIRGRDLTVIEPDRLAESWFSPGRRVVAAVARTGDDTGRALLLRPATTAE